MVSRVAYGVVSVARKAGGRSEARAIPDGGAEGLFAGIVDRIFEDPARSGGLMVVAMTATAIICNAMFLQNAHRPAPLFQARPVANTVPAAVPIPKPAPNFRDAPDAAPAVQPAPRAAVPAAPPLPRPSPAAKPAPAAAVSPAPVPAQIQAAADSVTLVTEIQRGLARLGIYTGTIDGRTGARTSAAIAKYEEAAGLKPTGQPTPALLYALQHPTAAPIPDTAAPAADPIATELDHAAQRRAAAIAAAARAAGQAQAAQTQTVATAVAPSAALSASTGQQAKLASEYRTVQMALNRIGYGPVPVDGTANKATIDAIRGFELDNGLPVSGEPSPALTSRLTAIGAIKSN